MAQEGKCLPSVLDNVEGGTDLLALENHPSTIPMV